MAKRRHLTTPRPRPSPPSPKSVLSSKHQSAEHLSERRADSIKQYLVANYYIAGGDLVTVGHGKTKLKDANDPTNAINRRVEVVNMESATALK